MQTAVRADPRARVGTLIRGPGRLAANGLGQEPEALLGVRAEVDPGVEAQKAEGQILGTRQDDRNYAEVGRFRLAIERLVLLTLLPRANSTRAEQDRDRAAIG